MKAKSREREWEKIANKSTYRVQTQLIQNKHSQIGNENDSTHHCNWNCRIVRIVFLYFYFFCFCWKAVVLLHMKTTRIKRKKQSNWIEKKNSNLVYNTILYIYSSEWCFTTKSQYNKCDSIPYLMHLTYPALIFRFGY